MNKRYLNPIPGEDHDVAYFYDGATITTDPTDISAANLRGSLSRVTNGPVAEVYEEFDALGQALKVTKTIAGDAPRTTRYTYDLAGKPIDMIYPDNYQIKNTYYPGTGLLQSVWSPSDFAGYAEYKNYPATGKIREAVYGKVDESNYAAKTTYTYDAFDPDHVHAVKGLTVNSFNYQFTYDANGNMKSGHDLTDPANPASRDIEYNSDNMPTRIEHSVHGVTTSL